MVASSFAPRQALLAITVLGLAGVGAALTGQYGFDMRPCPWCILQRLLFVLIALLALVGAATRARAAQRATAGAVLLLTAPGIAAALWQHFVAAKSSSCSLTFADKLLAALHVESLSGGLFGVTGSCADAAVDLLGVPFEFWSLALFVVLGGLALRALRRG